MKNVLFFSPPFFNYPAVIRAELQKNFGVVSYFNTVPSSRFYKISWYFETYFSCSFLKTKLIKLLFNSIKKRIIADKTEYNYIFVIKGSCIPHYFYDFLKKLYPRAIFIQYIWDDICNDPLAPTTFKYYDKIFSYNEKDCKKYNLLFRPFFYMEEYVSNIKERKYELSCIMSFSEDRINFLRMFFNTCATNKKKYILIKGSKILKIIHRSKIGNLKQYVSSKGISYAQMMKILQESTCQIDIQHPKQEGLTTRAFEALASSTKLITTNANIKKYDFYNPQNILIISRENPVINIEWLNLPYKPIENDILRKYTLSSFIVELFSND